MRLQLHHTMSIKYCLHLLYKYNIVNTVSGSRTTCGSVIRPQKDIQCTHTTAVLLILDASWFISRLHLACSAWQQNVCLLILLPAVDHIQQWGLFYCPVSIYSYTKDPSFSQWSVHFYWWTNEYSAVFFFTMAFGCFNVMVACEWTLTYLPNDLV